MSESEKRPILIGSIIHLKNVLPPDKREHEGYLDILKKVDEEPIIQMYHDPNVQAFVSTYKDLNQLDNRSGSWQVLSADGIKQTGDQLEHGDKIHLLNIHPDFDNLDSFEWVNRFKSVDGAEIFKDYPMQIGVFTSAEVRGRGVSGTWTIKQAADENDGNILEDEDFIELENAYPGAGFLHSYGIVAKQNEFEVKGKYNEHRLFVFTGPEPNTESTKKEVGSQKWQILLDLTKNLHRVYIQHGDKDTQLLDEGMFEIGDANKPVISLKFTSGDRGQTLCGTVVYKQVENKEVKIEKGFKATHRGQNIYDVELSEMNEPYEWSSVGQWQLGSRKFQRVVAMNIKRLEDKNNKLSGTMAYAGEASISIEVTSGITTSNDNKEYQPEWVRERTNRMESAVIETYNLLDESFKSISSNSIDSVVEHFYKLEQKKEDINHKTRKDLWDSILSDQTQNPSAVLDQDFQIEQSLNLHRLSCLLNSFFRYTLYPLMKIALENYRNDKDDTIPSLDLFRKCFQYVAADHEIIQQAVAQRRWSERPDEKEYSPSEQSLELLKLDKLAIRAVSPFKHLLENPDSKGTSKRLAIITYLSERTHIRLLPYTKQVILIGVSHDRVPPTASIFDDDELLGKDFYAYELMAIPHEVGHYMYRHGRHKGQTFCKLSEKFKDNPYFRWCEEIFADVYSCIVAGPLAAISMQALLMSIDRDRAWKDDEEHPTPVLRVFIFAEILRILQSIEPERYNFSDKTAESGSRDAPKNVIDTLDNDWAKILKKWRYDYMNDEDLADPPYRPVRVYMHDSSKLHVDTIVNVRRVIKVIEPIIREFATRLFDKPVSEDSKAHGGGNQDGNAKKLSMKIPWTNKNSNTTGKYNDVMTEMIDSDFDKKVESQLLFNDAVDEAPPDLLNPNEKLQQYLRKWGPKGPHGWGMH